MRVTVLCALSILAAGTAEASIVLHWFPATSFNSNTATMDATLGVTGFVKDTFETTTLIPGLSIVLTGTALNATWNSLPGLYNTTADPFATNNAWDGPNVVTNLKNNAIGQSIRSDVITFDYAPGAFSFGIGLSNFQSTSPPSPQFPITNHDLLINGVDVGSIEALAGANWTPGLVRDAYLRIDATGGSVIDSVGFKNLVTGGTEGLLFDHLAVEPAFTPEPATGWLVLGVLLAVADFRMSRGKARIDQ